MEISTIKTVAEAASSANISNYELILANNDAHLYQNDSSFILFDESNDIVWNLRRPIGAIDSISDKRISMVGATSESIEQIILGGSVKQIKDLISNLGLSLDDDQEKMLVNINPGNRKLMNPGPDDYTFRILSDEEIAKLTDAQKEKYEEALAAYEKRKALQENVQIIY